MAELPRLRSLQAGQEYDIPVILKKVGKIRLVSRRDGVFSNPYFAWNIKNIQTIPTGDSLRVRKSRTIRFLPRGSSFEQTDKLSVREAIPVNEDEVRRWVRDIISRQEIFDYDYLVLDYILDNTLTGYPRVVVWWLPDSVVDEGIEEARRHYQLGFHSGVLQVPSIIEYMLGHDDKYAEAQGYRVERFRRLSTNTNTNEPASAILASNVRAAERRNNNYSNVSNVGTLNVPRGSTNTVTLDDIEEGEDMVNFQGEHGYGRYYKASTFDQIPLSGRYKKNPTTRANITRNNVRKYKAHLVGGKRRKTRKQ